MQLEDGFDIISMQAQDESIYALTETGQIAVYNHSRELQLSDVIWLQDVQAVKGLDVDVSGFIWTIDNVTDDLVRFHPNGTLSGRIVSETISDFCWKPVDLTTTCDGTIVVADACGFGRFFAMKYSSGAAVVLHYSDDMPEQPRYVTTGPDGDIFFTGANYVAVFSKSGQYSQYRDSTLFRHNFNDPRQLFVDESGTAFISGSSLVDGNAFVVSY